jgi:type IV secretory pathway VirB3-like protein
VEIYFFELVFVIVIGFWVVLLLVIGWALERVDSKREVVKQDIDMMKLAEMGKTKYEEYGDNHRDWEEDDGSVDHYWDE